MFVYEIIYIYIYIYTYIQIHVFFVYVFIYVNMYVSIYVYIRAWMGIHISIYIHTYKCVFSFHKSFMLLGNMNSTTLPPAMIKSSGRLGSLTRYGNQWRRTLNSNILNSPQNWPFLAACLHVGLGFMAYQPL